MEWIYHIGNDTTGAMTEKEMLNNGNIIYSMLKSEKWSDNAIFALLGNMREESQVNPAISETGGDGYGLVQWTPGSIIKNWLTSHGYSIYSGEGQIKKILEEVKDGSQWITKPSYNISFSDWTKDETHDLEFMVNAFIVNYERPATTHHPIRVTYAKWFKDNVSRETEDKNQKIIDNAINFVIKICKDDSHGYDQTNRWGTPDYDCSSFMISAYEQAGLKLKENGASYTGDMKNAFLKCGFQVINFTNESELKPGDVLLNEVHHTGMYLGNGKIGEASINELGSATGGQKGDQTGKEICIKNYYNFPWDFALRLPTKGEPIEPPIKPPTPATGKCKLKRKLWYDMTTPISCVKNEFELITKKGNVVIVKNIYNKRRYFVRKSNIVSL